MIEKFGQFSCMIIKHKEKVSNTLAGPLSLTEIDCMLLFWIAVFKL